MLSNSAVMVPLLGAALVAVLTYLGHQQAAKRGDRQSEGYYRGQGLAWGLAAGLAIDAALTATGGNILWGIVIGVPAGLLPGLIGGEILERRHRDELIPLNSDEKDARRFTILLGLGAIVLAVLSVLGITLFSR